ncbi:MAG: N-acetylneuraminate synthase family protein [Spirochaetaceae bacterium]|nr:N-acetylneuraminate synthase family protein [Spirochaetaceae bacterium]
MAFDFTRLTSLEAGSPKTGSPQSSTPIIIAEIGTAHAGDLIRGLELIDAAADAGADIVKTQVVFAREILPPEAGLVPLPGGPTPLYEVFGSLERPPEFYAALAQRAEERGIGFLASPFGEKSVALLEDIGVKAWKIASPELNHEPLLERVAATGLPIILSTGVSRSEDIRRALDVIDSARPEAAAGRAPVMLLHCLTNYPAPENEANIRLIPALAAAYRRPVGLSDHSLNPVLIPALAAALGAAAVEKHITLNRDAGGLDDPVALTPGDFGRMTSAVRRYGRPAAGNTGEGSDSDLFHAAVAELSEEFGRDRVDACLGDGVKRLAPSEEAHYGRTNRSIHAVGPMTAGTVISDENTALLRTEKVLRPGIAPRDRERAYGRRLIRDIASGDGIQWEDLESDERR